MRSKPVVTSSLKHFEYSRHINCYILVFLVIRTIVYHFINLFVEIGQTQLHNTSNLFMFDLYIIFIVNINYNFFSSQELIHTYFFRSHRNLHVYFRVGTHIRLNDRFRRYSFAFAYCEILREISEQCKLILKIPVGVQCDLNYHRDDTNRYVGNIYASKMTLKRKIAIIYFLSVVITHLYSCERRRRS